MIKTLWIQARWQKKGKWDEYEESTGEVKKGIFGGEKPVMVKKRRWVETNENSDSVIDGKRLAEDMQTAMNSLEQEGFEIIGLSEVLSGNYNWTNYSSGSATNIGASTCASWGFSVNRRYYHHGEETIARLVRMG